MGTPKARANAGFTKRATAAWEALPDDVRHLSRRRLESTHKLSNGTIARVLDGTLTSPGPDVLARLAGLLRVSVGWLSGVEGDAAPAPSRSDRYPSRPGALAIARRRGYAETVIETVAALPLGDDDPGPEFWLQEVQRWHLLERTMPAADAPMMTGASAEKALAALEAAAEAKKKKKAG